MTEALKTVIVVRKDLDLPIGKWIAQAVHAILKVKSSNLSQIKDFYNDQIGPCVCIVCYVKKEADFYKLQKQCEENQIPFSMQIDAGHNFVAPETLTCMAIGPEKASKINMVTAKLQTFK